MKYNSDYKRREYTERQKQDKTVDIISLSLFIANCTLIIWLILNV